MAEHTAAAGACFARLITIDAEPDAGSLRPLDAEGEAEAIRLLIRTLEG